MHLLKGEMVMLLSELIYQVIKSCVWLDYEISKENIINNTYKGDADIGTFVNNVYVALNNSFNFALSLNKIAPVYKQLKEVENIYEVLAVNYHYGNDYKSLNFTLENSDIKLLNFQGDLDKVFVEYIVEPPILSNSTLSLNDLELKTYGVSQAVANACGNIASAELTRDIDPNLSYLNKKSAIDLLNILPNFGNATLHNQRYIEGNYKL